MMVAGAVKSWSSITSNFGMMLVVFLRDRTPHPGLRCFFAKE